MLAVFVISFLFHIISAEFTLTWDYISPKKLQGNFIDDQSLKGLIFTATEYSLHLTNMQGTVLVSYSQLDPSSLEREDFSLNVMGTFYPPNVTEISNMDLQTYLQSEAQYLMTLYTAMEKLGINGPDMPAAKGLYRIVLGYEKRKAKFGYAPDAVCRCNCPNAIKDYPACLNDNKSPAQCSDCLGMCGACGSCLASFCGDCCWYHGCCGHDICCYSGSSAACLFPINLTCARVYTCSGYNTNCCSQPPNRNVPPGQVDGNHCRTETWGCTPPTDGSCCANPWVCP
jgi:hypothetical protein